MGYTIYWEFLDWHGQWQTTWRQFIDDAKLIIEAADILVCGPEPDEFPRHYYGRIISEDIDFWPPVCEVEDGIWLNGLAEDGHEPFVLRRSHRNYSCKTALKPYETVVGCILLRAYQLQPDLTIVCCDGNWDENWVAMRELYSILWPHEEIKQPSSLHRAEERPSGLYYSKSWLKRADTKATTSISHDLGAPIAPTAQDTTKSSFDLLPERAQNVASWLIRCTNDPEHESCRSSPFSWSTLPGVHFRLIDVERRCIVRVPSAAPDFAVLSYVWGGVKQVVLSSNTEKVLLRRGGLDRTGQRLPNTIDDAIAFCKSIGLRYLWVDALCIKQDSGKDLKLQMRRMRAVYAGARVTIAVATGTDADTRIVSDTNKQIDSERLSVLELANILRSSAWYTRAWTYQELVLSHRVIFCTSAGIFPVCQRTAIDVEGQPLPFSHRLLIPDLLLGTPRSLSDPLKNHQLHCYLRTVEEFSRRKLSFPSDALNAFQGIIQNHRTTLDEFDNAFYYGLPTSAFDQTFCFRTKYHDPMTRRNDFPSWSWLGWSQPVKFDVNLIDRIRTWNMIHPPILESSHMSWPNSIEWDTAGFKDLWRPIMSNPYCRHVSEYGEWGFPSAIDSFKNEPALSAAVSVADLRIASNPTRVRGSQACYNVLPVRCSQTPPDPPPKMITLGELFYRPLPKPYMPSAEEKQMPLIPADRQTKSSDADYHAEDFHTTHDDCEADNPLGQIWLNKEWRDSKPKDCIMGFVALCGEKRKKTGWLITRLMLTQRLKKVDAVWARERIQTMDCEISKNAWMSAGAEVLDQKFI